MARFISVPAHCQLCMNAKSLRDIDFEKRKGLLPVIVQDRKTKDILMLAYVNKEALDSTIRTGNARFWSTVTLTRFCIWSTRTNQHVIPAIDHVSTIY